MIFIKLIFIFPIIIYISVHHWFLSDFGDNMTAIVFQIWCSLGYSFRCEQNIYSQILKRGPNCHEAVPRIKSRQKHKITIFYSGRSFMTAWTPLQIYRKYFLLTSKTIHIFFFFLTRHGFLYIVRKRDNRK